MIGPPSPYRGGEPTPPLVAGPGCGPARHLGDRARPDQIDTAVADVAEIHPALRKPGQAHGGLRAFNLVVTTTEINECAMHLQKKFRQGLGVDFFGIAGGRGIEPRQQPGDFFHGDITGELAGFRTAHAVAHSEGEGMVRR